MNGSGVIEGVEVTVGDGVIDAVAVAVAVAVGVALAVAVAVAVGDAVAVGVSVGVGVGVGVAVGGVNAPHALKQAVMIRNKANGFIFFNEVLLLVVVFKAYHEQFG